jgi:hypothetical protein
MAVRGDNLSPSKDVQWLTRLRSAPPGSRNHQMEQYASAPSPEDFMHTKFGGDIFGKHRAQLTLAHRHDHEPSQVLPLDATNSVALVRIRYVGASDVGYRGIHDGCE